MDTRTVKLKYTRALNVGDVISEERDGTRYTLVNNGGITWWGTYLLTLNDGEHNFAAEASMDLKWHVW
jgi:hypothetical protein